MADAQGLRVLPPFVWAKNVSLGFRAQGLGFSRV